MTMVCVDLKTGEAGISAGSRLSDHNIAGHAGL